MYNKVSTKVKTKGGEKMNRKIIAVLMLVLTISFLLMGALYGKTAETQKGIEVSFGTMVDGEFVSNETGTLGGNQRKYEILQSSGKLFYGLSGVTGIDNSGVDKFGEAFPVIFAILVILMLVVIAANFILRTKDDSKEAIRRKVKILEKQSNVGAEWYIVECENGERLRLRNFQGYKVFITVGDEGILEYKGLTIKSFQKL